MVENLVVRPVSDDFFEVLSGNHRLKVIKEAGFTFALCVVANLGDAHARLLAQALNHIRGDDNLGLRAELLRKALETVTEQQVLAIIPETAGTLQAIASMGQQDMTAYLQNWQQAKTTKLRHMMFQLTQGQLEVVEETLARIMPQASQLRHVNPNLRGNTLYLLCKRHLEDNEK
ncbi:MAG: ParB-like nuclease protein [Dehalococcoidales bacterium]|nr:ParB-like nuclease protein [Dehalococcoidales bacterium]